MPALGQGKITPALQKTITELLWLAFTDEQIALFCDLSSKTIQRMRAGLVCPAIKKGEIKREAIYRKRVWSGKGYWQGAAWFLERKYPHQFAKPEIQLNVNNDNRQVHQTLIISAEVAGQINDRMKATKSKVQQLLKDKRPNHSNGN